MGKGPFVSARKFSIAILRGVPETEKIPPPAHRITDHGNPTHTTEEGSHVDVNLRSRKLPKTLLFVIEIFTYFRG
jgi:hypothetical protein